MKNLSLHVYVITTSVPELGRSHEDIAAASIAGGADVLQFRDKTVSDEEFTERSTKLLAISRTKRVPLIINDRAEIAINVGADGVHLGQADFQSASHIHSLRQMWSAKISRDPSEFIVGISARNFEEAIAMQNCGADYLGVGPIFATGSKSDASAPIGSQELARICHTVNIPIVAIGGITAGNLPEIIATGAVGAAVIAAVAHARDMRLATKTLQDVWKHSQLGHGKIIVPRKD